MKYRWTIAPAQPALADFLAQRLKISSLLAQCLLNRGMSEPDTIERFLEPRLKNLADPFLLIPEIPSPLPGARSMRIDGRLSWTADSSMRTVPEVFHPFNAWP